jgi:50S ribosomal protein L4
MFLRPKLFLNYHNKAARFFSSELVRIIPPNLLLADETILQPEKERKFRDEEYLFPLLNPPEKISVYSFKRPGEVVKEASLSKVIFGVAIRKDIVHEVVRYQRAKIRQPHKTKRIGEISGSNKKPRPQKGQGYSQVGNKRNSAWRGGMKAHGPVLRDFSISLNRKYRAQGLMIALAAKQREGNLIVFDEMTCEVMYKKVLKDIFILSHFNLQYWQSHKTKDLRLRLIEHGLIDFRTLFVDGNMCLLTICFDNFLFNDIFIKLLVDLEPNFLLASRNLPLLNSMPQRVCHI